tara:strand:+ start:53 stop:838 length:786 start_codon:yes stop_codon:yes gene_type:complete
MKNNLKCIECGKEYYRPPSKQANSKFCSASCRNKHLSKSKRKEKVTVKCVSCDVKFEKYKDSSKKYCNRKCYKEDVLVERVEKKCPTCGIIFKKSKNRMTKYCSKSCLNEAQSSGLQEIPSNGRMGFRRDLNPNYFFKSSLEADYARWCEATGKNYIYEHKTFTLNINGKEKKYTPDFYHPDDDLYVETKAMRIDKKFGGNLNAVDILKSQGVNIEVLTMREFYKNIKLSNHYWLIENIENKNYLGTRHLIYLKKKSQNGK